MLICLFSEILQLKASPEKSTTAAKDMTRKGKAIFKNKNVLESNASRKRGMFSDDAAYVFFFE